MWVWSLRLGFRITGQGIRVLGARFGIGGQGFGALGRSVWALGLESSITQMPPRPMTAESIRAIV